MSGSYSLGAAGGKLRQGRAGLSNSSAMVQGLNGRTVLLVMSIISSLTLEDLARCYASAVRSGPEGRTEQRSRSLNNAEDDKGPSQQPQNIRRPQSYRSNAELLAAMKEYVARCSKISRLYTIGKSVNGVPLMVVEISDFPGKFEPKPAFKYVGNMHGDEPSGRELTMYLAEWLCDNYLKETTATFIVQNVHLHLLPSMNPDGFESSTRNNANDVDLNRDFPDQYNPLNNKEPGRQPETLAIMKWIKNIPFTASASLHEGALVASYGWDGTLTGRTGYSESPDDAGFRQMASLYSQSNPMMKSSSDFLGGITNGAAWYTLYGGMQDWNYIHGNCFEITLEISEGKWPNITKIPELWQQNQQSMLELVASVAKTGVHGRVMSAADGSPIPAMIIVKGNEHIINASATLGDYHRLLPPGKNYELKASFPGFFSRQTNVVLSQWKATTLDFILQPVPSKDDPKEIECKEQELAFHCTQPQLPSKMQTDLLDAGIRPWLPRKLVTSFDHQNKISAVHLELLIVVSSGTLVICVAAVLFVLVRRRRSLKGQATRYLWKKT